MQDVNLSKLQEILKDKGAWHTAVHGVAQSQTRNRDLTTIQTCRHSLPCPAPTVLLSIENSSSFEVMSKNQSSVDETTDFLQIKSSLKKNIYVRNESDCLQFGIISHTVQ